WVRRGRARARQRATSRAACPPRASRGPSRGPSGLSLSPSRYASPFTRFTHTAEAVALDLLVEIAARHLQCARGLRHVPVVLLQLHEQKRPLGGLLEFLKRGCA